VSGHQAAFSLFPLWTKAVSFNFGLQQLLAGQLYQLLVLYTVLCCWRIYDQYYTITARLSLSVRIKYNKNNKRKQKYKSAFPLPGALARGTHTSARKRHLSYNPGFLTITLLLTIIIKFLLRFNKKKNYKFEQKLNIFSELSCKLSLHDWALFLAL
jgi:hypothetical protein